MTHIGNLKRITMIVLTILMVTALVLIDFSHTVDATEEYRAHSRISIYEDMMFDSEHGVTGGKGTKDDPYVIEGWRIDASKGTGIYIGYTNAYFVIRKCLIENGSRSEYGSVGIILSSLRNGRIEDCIFRNNKYGIRVYNSSNIAIAHCTIYNSSAITLWIGVIEGGIEVDISKNVTITDCKSYNNIGHGICLHSTSNALIRNCEVYNNLHSGIRLEDGESTLFGMKLKFPPTNNSLIVNCKAYNNSYGISLLYSTNNTVKDCELHENSYGIHLQLSSTNTVTGCTVRNNSIGIMLDFAKDNLIYNNLFNNTKPLAYDNFTFNMKNCEVYGAMLYPSRWSMEKHEGRNIVGGEYIGGNFWSDYNGTDNDGDGIGDEPYVIDEYNRDNYPLIKPKTPVEEKEKPPMLSIYAVPIILASITVATYLLIRRRRQSG